jgi:mycoredoxin
MSKQHLVYGRPGCPRVYPVRTFLKNAEIEYTYIDIYQDDEARERVRSINGGNESVPTIVFSDGSTLTEPSSAELRKQLLGQGYTVGSLALFDRLQVLIQHPVVLTASIGLLLAGAFLKIDGLIIPGMVILVFVFLNRIIQGGG